MKADEQQSQNGLFSADDIRRRFYGSRPTHTESASFQPFDPPTTAAPRNTAQGNDLTPSARHIARQAKKRLGEQYALDDHGSSVKRVLPEEMELYQLVTAIEAEEGEALSERERACVVATLSASLDHYDILTPLVENPAINDIIITSYRDISVQTHRSNMQTDLSFPDQHTYTAFVENLLKRAGKACTVATPVVDAAIDPHVRACATHESFSPLGSGPMLTLRISRHRRASLHTLEQNELAPSIILEYLSALVREGRATLLIAGEVGTGKTTLVKVLTSCIPEQEALLVIEDTHEIVLERPFVRTLLTREANTEGTGRIPPAMAIRTGMRMAMNRIILGEMRDAEAAEAFIDVCASGHAGMSTIHARSARDALCRLELFLSRAQGNIGIDAIRKQIANAISVVVALGFDKNTQKRRIVEVLEVGTSADGAVQISPIFSFHPAHSLPRWNREGGVSIYHDLLRESGITLPFPGETFSFALEEIYRSLA